MKSDVVSVVKGRFGDTEQESKLASPIRHLSKVTRFKLPIQSARDPEVRLSRCCMPRRRWVASTRGQRLLGRVALSNLTAFEAPTANWDGRPVLWYQLNVYQIKQAVAFSEGFEKA